MSKSMQIPEKRIETVGNHVKTVERVWSISKIEKRRECVRALWYEQCPKNSFKRLYTLKGLLVLVEKASFSKEFRSEFHSGGGGNISFGYTYSTLWIDQIEQWKGVVWKFNFNFPCHSVLSDAMAVTVNYLSYVDTNVMSMIQLFERNNLRFKLIRLEHRKCFLLLIFFQK